MAVSQDSQEEQKRNDFASQMLELKMKRKDRTEQHAMSRFPRLTVPRLLRISGIRPTGPKSAFLQLVDEKALRLPQICSGGYMLFAMDHYQVLPRWTQVLPAERAPSISRLDTRVRSIFCFTCSKVHWAGFIRPPSEDGRAMTEAPAVHIILGIRYDRRQENACARIRSRQPIAMRIATFNINNVNKRLPNLLQWLKQSKPDIVCLQELKCEARDFPEAALLKAGYFAVLGGPKVMERRRYFVERVAADRYPPAVARRSC